MPVKPRAPEYPRPVSPLCGEEAPVSHNTIVYYECQSSQKEDEIQRASKRQRIEAHATSYLRGQSLFILTASLRGPFDDGWRNPWADKSMTTSATEWVPGQSEVEISRHVVEAAQPETRCTEQQARPDFSDSALDGSSHVNDNDTNAPIPKISNVGNAKAAHASIFGRGFPLKESIVEVWPGTSLAVDPAKSTHLGSLPVSPSDGKVNPSRTLDITAGPLAEPAHAIAAVKASPPRKPLKRRPEPATTSFSSPVHSPAPMAHDADRNIHSSPLKRKRRRISSRSPGAAVEQQHQDQYPVDSATSKSRPCPSQVLGATPATESRKPRVEIICEPAATPKQAEPEMKVQGHEPSAEIDLATKHDLLESSNEPSDLFHSAPVALSGPTAISLAHEDTASTVTSLFPSAQVPQMPVLISLSSNLSSHDRMIQDLPRETASTGLGIEHIDQAIDQLGQPEEVPQEAPILQRESTINSAKAFEQNGLGALEKKSGDGPMAAPFAAMPTVQTIKKSLDITPNANSPISGKKSETLRSKKRQVFANGEKSSGSIKSAMKVAKQPPGTAGETSSTKLSLQYNELQNFSENNTHHEAMENEGHKTSAAPSSTPRSILKPLSQRSTGVHVLNTGSSSSTKQDAQRPGEINQISHDVNDSELEGMMDDLGSFLDTWDAEKQAAGVL